MEPDHLERGASLGSMNHSTTTESTVPLCLSSLAHVDLSLNEGVLDGLRQVLQHTLLQCVNYARLVHPPHNWNFRDLGVSEFAWAPRNEDGLDAGDLAKLGFCHHYSRNALVYLKAAIPVGLSLEKENEFLENWSSRRGILGRVRLLYTSTEPLTEGEKSGTDVEDVPPCILYKVVVEYRALPATGNVQAVHAEELSMLSFGGSVDDDVKYGALSSLYDKHAKYALEIYSIRGKKYKFDLMDSTLADRTVPHLPSSREGDPFAKSLCLTVGDHTENSMDGSDLCAITRMHFTLEGKPRNYQRGDSQWHSQLPGFSDLAVGISSSFLRLNPHPPEMVEASPSGHTLLLDPQLAGHIYVNGKFATTWGGDNRIGSHGVALFGMDLHSIPFWHGRIVDFEALKTAYAQLWHEVLVDARLEGAGLATRLLCRLMYNDDAFDDEVQPDKVKEDCLESIVLSAPNYDPVGIAAKALQTCFKKDFGDQSFPCLPHETEWVRTALPGLEPIIVPQRVINILRRGGFFDTQKTADLFWFAGERSVHDGFETNVVNAAIQLLETAGCTDVGLEEIVIVSPPPSASHVIGNDLVCRYNVGTQQFYVQEEFMTTPVEEFFGEGSDRTDPVRIKGYLLGMYIAKAHPFGKILARYVIRNKP